MANLINPQSQCKLLNVAIQNDYKNQYTFTSLEAQTNFFLSKAISNGFVNLTFVKDGVISLPGQIYSLYNANYLMFQNTGFSNKWFYAFITEIEYVNQNSCLVHYEIDVFQTWYFDITYKSSFIVREHVTDDTVGVHTVPENLEMGEYVVDGIQSFNMGDMVYVVQCTAWANNVNNPFATNYGGVPFSGGGYVCTSLQILRDVIRDFETSTAVSSDAIYNVYMVPRKFIVIREEGAIIYTQYPRSRFSSY